MWQFWRHTPSGDIYAVKTTSLIDGDFQMTWIVNASSGALRPYQVTKRNLQQENFATSTEVADWIQEHMEFFEVHEV